MAIQIPKTKEDSDLKKQMLSMAFDILKERNRQISSNNYFKVEKLKDDKSLNLELEEINSDNVIKIAKELISFIED